MKKIVLLIFIVIFTSQLIAQKTEISQLLKGIKSFQIKDTSIVDYSFIKETKGKIVIIEFWETWCAPCIKGMHHLKELKRKFPKKLKVICVSSDNFERTTKFINKNSYPFDFIYDKDKQFSEIFPHSGIPHSIVIDINGKIQAETYPGFINETSINKLKVGNSIKIPKKENFNSESLNNSFSNSKIKTSLISFELLPYKLGDRNHTESFKRPNKRTIITGYSGNVYKDTIEVIESFKGSGQNILNLYMIAFGKFTKNRFIFNKDLNYIKSQTPNQRFRVKFEASNMQGNFNSLFINQLNASFGLKTSIIEKEVEYFELVNIELKKDTIMLLKKPSIKIKGSEDISFKEFKISQFYSANKITNLIENQIIHLQSNKYYNNKEKRIYFPITTKLKGKYALNISIEDESSSLEKWIELFRQNGFTLIKKKGKVKYIKIEKLMN